MCIRDRLIDSLMADVEKYDLDGLNMDFEGLKQEAGVHYVQFLRELSIPCRQKGIVLSVDNTVPAEFNKFYDRKEQGIVVDYVVIMGYDEHYNGGAPGSVASLGYVRDGIENTLKLVPREKVILGAVSYTHLDLRHTWRTYLKKPVLQSEEAWQGWRPLLWQNMAAVTLISGCWQSMTPCLD